MERSNPLKGILRPEDLRNPYVLAGLAGTIATSAALDSLAARTIDRIIHTVALPKVKKSTLDYTSSPLWHGTGRYRYKDGEVVDILESISETGYILPNLDKFDINRPMVSISLAKSRMYARAYADMHGAGSHEINRYGGSLFWACSFLGSIALEASKETKVWKPSGYYKMLGHLAAADTIGWYENITHMVDPSVVSVYQNGSDIHDNYPVLFNVRGANPTETSKAVKLHEIRTEDVLDLVTDIDHIEVPLSRIDETKAIMPGVSILPIEMGEEYCSSYTFSQHMHEIV